ncbi:MAG: hypothetical protein KDE19_23230 [Caldilineaceae bacterium]|nr:hypothetical protein [Caldilineaceae bacterium]
MPETNKATAHAANMSGHHLAEAAYLDDHFIAMWQRTFLDPDSADHILHSPDFYFREVHGLVTATAP